MNKLIKKSLILISLGAFLAGVPTVAIVFLLLNASELLPDTAGVVSVLLFNILTIIAVGAIVVLAAMWTASYISNRMRAEYKRVSAPDVSEASAYPELAPFFEMINAQQREIEHQLARVAKEKNRLSTIINNMDEGLIILDNDLKIIMLNESAYSWLGTALSRDECTGKHVSEVCASAEICECIERADSVNLTIDGRQLQLHVNHVVSSAVQVGRIGLMLDVTERSQLDRIKQEFTANVSHELKTPLTSISGYAELIESGMAQGDDTIVFAGRIRRESQRMLSLISDIIKLSKLDEASDTSNYESVDIYKLAAECRDMLEMSAAKNGITVNVTGEKTLVTGITSELTELVYNLVDNGIRYNKSGGSVNVKVTAPSYGIGDPIAILTVSDTGIGIPKEHQGRVFERFYRVDKSRSKETGGTGLGLAIVKHVAERHGAKIEIDSREGEGTAIRVEFYLSENAKNNDN